MKQKYWFVAIGALIPGILKYLIVGECNWNTWFHPEKECVLKRKK